MVSEEAMELQIIPPPPLPLFLTCRLPISIIDDILQGL